LIDRVDGSANEFNHTTDPSSPPCGRRRDSTHRACRLYGRTERRCRRDLGGRQRANGTDQERSGTVTVVGPGGDTQLEESFTVAPSESDDEDGESSSTPTYGDVFTESGEYTVTVELESAINETSSREATVTVNDTENQHIIVGLGADDAPTPIEVLVIDEFSDLADRFDDAA